LWCLTHDRFAFAGCRIHERGVAQQDFSSAVLRWRPSSILAGAGALLYCDPIV
jgi:hypothetical protein